jgi:hypothetical protein
MAPGGSPIQGLANIAAAGANAYAAAKPLNPWTPTTKVGQ